MSWILHFHRNFKLSAYSYSDTFPENSIMKANTKGLKTVLQVLLGPVFALLKTNVVQIQETLPVLNLYNDE